jgi:arabinofuranan 3-O-arabinosyltransferase
MSEAFRTAQAGTSLDQRAPRILGIFARWRLLAYGYTFPVFYGAFFLYLYCRGLWLANESGAPVYHDFTSFWLAGWQALHGETASLYDQAAFKDAQDTSAGLGRSPHALLSYPPTFTLILVLLAMLPYFTAFLTWEAVTLVFCVAVVYLIVRRQPAISLMLASPFAAWNFLIGQNGFLTASLLGASLLLLERRPVLAGVFIGCLTYKPQFGVLVPVALIAANHWRACASAAVTAALLGLASVAGFGVDGWVAFPRALFAQGSETLFASPDWGFLFQTVYGLILVLHGGAALAWLAQSLVTVGVGIIVWLVWRSPVRYALKAATLSAGALIATPYALAYDLAMIAIPVAFLAGDQIRCGLLRGEQTTMIALFVASLAIIPTEGKAPVGAVILVALLCLILRRARPVFRP